MRHLRVLIFTLLGTLLYGCAQESDQPVRLGTNVWPGYEPLYLARDLGYLSQSVRLVEYRSASDVLRAFRNKSLEAASLTLDEVLSLKALDIPLAVVLIHDISNGADVIIANTEIEQMDDLVGKRVGVESGALGAFVISRALELNGLTAKDIRIKAVSVNRHEQAFKQDDVDAVVTFEPVRTKLLAFGGNEIFTSKEIPGEIVDVLVVHQDYLDRHPQIIQQLVDGWFKALNYMQSHRDDALDKMAKRLNISAAEVAASYDGLLLPNRVENNELLGGDKPKLANTADKLNQSMVDMSLLTDNVNTEALFDARFVQP